MAELPKIIKDFRVYVNEIDTGYSIKSLQLPNIVEKTEDIELGCFTSETFMGLEKLELEFVMYDFNTALLTSWGVGNNLTGQIITFRGYQENNYGELDELKISMKARFKALENASLEKGGMGEVTIKAHPTFYTMSINNVPYIVIDTINNNYTIAGVNQLQAVNKALGTQ